MRVATVSDYLDLTLPSARRQWRDICGRRWPANGKRQVVYCPVETLLCYGLFFVLQPNRYGGANIETAPDVLHQLARIFKRSANSLLQKMFNLDGTRANGGEGDLEVGIQLAGDWSRYAALYATILRAARDEGLGEVVPDFLSDGDVLESPLSLEALQLALPEETRAVKASSRIGPERTERLAVQRVRVGHKRFVRRVLSSYDHRCGFCGLAPHRTRRRGLLIAAHIKPWRDATNQERMDPRNGIAACPTHDRAFEYGLLVVNGGMRIHRSPELEADMVAEQVPAYFGQGVLRERLLVPNGAAPAKEYLDHHRAQFHWFSG